MSKVTGLLVMDVDSTLIQEEGIDLLGEAAGVGEKVAQITEKAMRGELDFEAALKERVQLLKGLPLSIFDEIAEKIHFTPGAARLVEKLHQCGYKVGLVSGGFHETVDRLAEQLQIDYVWANCLEKENGALTGKVLGDIVTKETKKHQLEIWAAENGLSLQQTVAMGDGANDLPMILTAGIGVAFNAKPIVREQAPYQINEPNLLALLDILDAVRDEETDQ